MQMRIDGTSIVDDNDFEIVPELRKRLHAFNQIPENVLGFVERGHNHRDLTG
jgi:hypothetical protein